MRLLILSFLAILISCAHAPRRPQPTVDIVQDALPSVVTLQNGDEVFCSGWIIRGTGLIATANHCIEKSFFFKVGWGDKTFKTEVVERDGFTDLAILKPVGLTISPKVGLHMSTALPRAGESVIVLGHAYGVFEEVVSKGIVSHPLKMLDNGQRFIMIDAAIVGGQSGGPSLDDKGRVIGINSFTLISTTWCETEECESQYYRSPYAGLVPVREVRAALNEF